MNNGWWRSGFLEGKVNYSAILDTSLIYKTIYTISIILPANYNSIKTSH